jgi:hypothetical protein
MEKLIELLSEYNDNKEWARIWFITTVHIDWVPTPYELGKSDLLRWEDKIISKKYWFIKWLVENDKIETNNLNLKVFKSMFSNDWTVEISYEELVLMLLAISDEPIEFLCEILK